jgi:hypothetical protein
VIPKNSYAGTSAQCIKEDRLMEQFVTQEWAMIASLGNEHEVGTIPQHYRAQTSEAATGIERAFVESIYEAGLRTQNYDKGLEKFIRK